MKYVFLILIFFASWTQYTLMLSAKGGQEDIPTLYAPTNTSAVLADTERIPSVSGSSSTLEKNLPSSPNVVPHMRELPLTGMDTTLLILGALFVVAVWKTRHTLPRK